MSFSDFLKFCTSGLSVLKKDSAQPKSLVCIHIYILKQVCNPSDLVAKILGYIPRFRVSIFMFRFAIMSLE